MKLSILAAILAFSVAGQAQVVDNVTNKITCQFTEPNIEVTVDLNGDRATITDSGMGDEPVIIERNATLIQDERVDMLLPAYDLKSSDGKTIIRLQLNLVGSDGASNINYPLSAYYTRVINNSHAQGLVGGCETNMLKASQLVETAE